MNICLLSKSQLSSIGGIETYTDLIADSYVKLGHNVHIITSGRDNSPTLEKKYINNGVFIHKINFRDLTIRGSWRLDRKIPLSLFIYSQLVCRKINELIMNYKLDIVESPNRAFEGMIYSFKRTIPIVVRLHGGVLVDQKLNLSQYKMRDRIIGRFEKSLIYNADCVTSPSRSIAQIANINYKVSKRIHIIPNPVNIKQFYPSSVNETKDPTILYVGRFHELKGVFVLAEAIPKVLAQFPKARFVFIGPDTPFRMNNGSCKEYLSKKINDRRVIFYNEMPPEELVNFYHKSWICILPSFYESFGMVALEGMACGKAVIATKVGGLSEIIEDRVDGILIPPNNIEALIAAIEELLRNKEYMKQLGINAYKKAKKYFCLNKVTCETLKIYENTINKFYHQRK